MTSKYYTGNNEIVFMATLLKSEYLLKKFLEKNLEREVHKIKVLNPNLITDKINNRIQKLDLLLEVDDEYVNIELNARYSKILRFRNTLYLFKTVLSRAEKGKIIYDINKKITQINVNFNIRKYEKEETMLYNLTRKQIVTDIFKIYDVNVDAYVKKYYNENKEFSNGDEIIIMLGLDKEELTELAQRSEIVMEYKKIVDEVNNQEELFKWFSADEERQMYEDALFKQGKEDGLIEGKEAGLIEGEKKGKQSGLIEGKKSGIISVAKNMLAEGMNIDLISKLTKLSKSQISRLL